MSLHLERIRLPQPLTDVLPAQIQSSEDLLVACFAMYFYKPVSLRVLGHGVLAFGAGILPQLA